MPHFGRTFTQGAPIINLGIGVSAARAQALVAAHQPIPPMQTVQGLIDTGASGTCVDPLVLAALQLDPTGSIPMLTPSTGNTPVDTDTYDVSVFIASAPGMPPLSQFKTCPSLQASYSSPKALAFWWEETFSDVASSRTTVRWACSCLPSSRTIPSWIQTDPLQGRQAF